MKVRVSEVYPSSLVLSPVNKKIANKIQKDAIKNGAPEDFKPEVFDQNPYENMDSYPKNVFYKSRWSEHYDINDGAIVLMDDWEFRHMVGYCSD